MSAPRAPFSRWLLSRPLASLRCAYSTAAPPTASKPPATSKSSKPPRPQKQNAPRRTPNIDNGRSKGPRPRTAKPAQNSASRNEPPRGRGIKMFIPSPARKFIRDGRLFTTPDVWEFLQSTKIQYDNSKTKPLPLSQENQHISSTFACRISFSNQYILHPYHLLYLQPRGHPWIEGLKSRYRTKLKTQPLWIYFTPLNDHTGLVRTLGQRRLAREFWTALDELEKQEGITSRLKGTIIVTIFDSKKAASAPAVQFGKALADAVIREQKKKTRTT